MAKDQGGREGGASEARAPTFWNWMASDAVMEQTPSVYQTLAGLVC